MNVNKMTKEEKQVLRLKKNATDIIMNFKLGDKVRIINSDKTYSTYDDWAKINNLKNFKRGFLAVGINGTIIAKGEHEYLHKIIYAVKTKIADLIIDKEGLMLLKKNKRKLK